MSDGTTMAFDCSLLKSMKMSRCVNGLVFATGAVCPDGASFVGTSSKTIQCAAVYKEVNYGRKGDNFTYSSGMCDLLYT